MNVSRLDKFVRERIGAASLGEAHAVRDRDVELRVGARANSMLVRSAVALALRCFSGSVCVSVDPTAPTSLVNDAVAEALAYGTPHRLVATPSTDCRAVRIGLGRTLDRVPFADAAGWTAAVNEVLSSDESPSAPAAAFAVACVFGKVFAGLLGASTEVTEEKWTFALRVPSMSTRDTPSSDPFSVGTLVLIGAGAIGAAFLFIVRMSGWTGHLRIVDPQNFDEPNHETTLLISVDDANNRQPKAMTLARLTARDGLTTEGVGERVDNGHQQLSAPCNALVCAVDNPETRCILDDANCGVLLNAGVGGDHFDAGLVIWSRHGHGDGSLASLYERATFKSPTPTAPPPPSELDSDECSRLAYENVALAAPFMALAAGALLAAGLVNHIEGDRSGANYLQFDILELQRKFSARCQAA